MGRIQSIFNLIAVVGATIHILAGIIAVYYLIPKSNVVHEEILSRRSRSLEPEILIEEKIALEGNIKNSDEETSNQCFTADTCGKCVAISTSCFWFGNKSACLSLDTDTKETVQKSIIEIYEEGIGSVSWGSCEVPLASSLFFIISIVAILVVVLSLVLLHLICKRSQEEKMLLEVETAAKKENFLKRLGRLNPLPNNFQEIGNNMAKV